MAASWTVTGDTPDQYSSVGGGAPVIGHVITFQTGKGFRGSVFITNDQYQPTTVKAAIQAKANIVDEINTLSVKD